MTPLATLSALLFVLLGFGLALGAVLVARLVKRRETTTRSRVRLTLPLSSGVSILPGTSAQITARPQDAFCIDGLFLEDAADWVINDLLVGGVSQFVQSGDVPGGLFSGLAQGGGMRLSVAPAGADVRVLVTNISDGPREFRCAALGTRIEGDPIPGELHLILPLSSGVHVLPNQSAQVTSRPVRHTFRPERLVIQGGKDWIVNEIKTGNRSQFLQSGDVPGAAFDATVNTALRMESVSPMTDFVVVVTYVGKNPDGAPFLAAVVGEATQERRSRETSRPPRVALIGTGRPDATMRIVPAA